MKAAIYCRLSCEDPEHSKESESICNQRAMLLRYARENGYEIYRIYIDENRSGADRDRPEFNRMIEDARCHRFEAILCKSQARFSREMEQIEHYLHGAFPAWGVRFLSIADQADTGDAANKKSRQLHGLINEWYLEELSENVRAVLKHKRTEGQYAAAFCPYGYRRDPADKNHLVIDPPAAATVRRIFALYLSGWGPTAIARAFNQEKLPTPTEYKRRCGSRYRTRNATPNDTLWSRGTVHTILKHRVYRGDTVQGRYKKVSCHSQKVVRLSPGEWDIVPNTHEPIIDKATFEQVQQRIRQNCRSGPNSAPTPLAGKLVCGLCGSKMQRVGSGEVGKDGSPRYYYRCRVAPVDPSRCAGQPYLSVREISALVLERIRFHLQAAECSSHLASPPDRTPQAAAYRKLQNQLHRRNSRIATLRAKMQILYLDKVAGTLTDAAFRNQFEALQQELAEQEAALPALAQELCRIGQRPETRSTGAVFPPPELTAELVDALVQSITVFPPAPEGGCRRVVIRWNF